MCDAAAGLAQASATWEGSHSDVGVPHGAYVARKVPVLDDIGGLLGVEELPPTPVATASPWPG